MRLILSAFVFLAVPAAHAASLRGDTTLADPMVKLSDIWDGVTNDRAIGPGPEPGGRIVVEAAQLAAIARQFDVDWRPSSSGDRIVIERPGRAVAREDVLAALRAAAATAGVSRDADIDLPGFTPPLAAAEVVPHCEVGQLDIDASSGRFTAVLSVTGAGMQPVHARLSGRIMETVEVPVAARRMMPGDVVGAQDIQMARIHAVALHTEVAQAPAQAIGMALRHPVGPGAPFPIADLTRPMAVQRGDAVQMQLDVPGLQLSAQGVAMEAGAIGEHVRVLNASSRAVVDAEVVAGGQVRVTGLTPTLLPPGQTVPLRVAAR